MAVLQVLLVASSRPVSQLAASLVTPGPGTAAPGSASHLWRDGCETKGQGWGCPGCHSRALQLGTRSPVVHVCDGCLWMCCVGVRPSVLAVCPAAAYWVPGPRKHPHPAPASPGHPACPVPVTLLVPRQFQTPKSPAQPFPCPAAGSAGVSPLARARLGAHPHPCRCRLPAPRLEPAFFPVLTVSLVTPALLPCCRCPDAGPRLRCRFFPALPVLPAGASAGAHPPPRCR